jgi:uncharacterized protein YwqG
MSFWKKIFGKQETIAQSKKSGGHAFAKTAESSKLTPRLDVSDDLEKLVKPLVRKTTKIEVKPASKPPENSQMNSHFGGQPYFEEGADWPKNKSGKALDFIFQIYNDQNLELPQNIKLVQFFYDWEELPWDTQSDGWFVKTHKDLDTNKRLFIRRPAALEGSKYCRVELSAINTLPDWEGIDLFGEEASQLSCDLNDDEPWDEYDKVVTKLVGEQKYQSQLGGYPNWVQGESTPLGTNGKPMKLLFQIDSENHAGLMWGDVGLIYVFYEPESDHLEFTLQCH